MFFLKTLPNGIRIVGQKIPHVRSVSVGAWIGTGSVKEVDGERGISHFIEHMLFKGTKKRTAQDIAVEMDSLGSHINAFTSKECTCFYVRAIDEHLTNAIDVLGDVVLHSKFDHGEMEKEKGVVVEEILMVDDSPEDLALDLITETFFHGHPLGRPILGTKESVKDFTKKDIRSYMDKHYTPNNILIACAGNFDEEALTEAVEKAFDMQKAPSAPPQPWPESPQRQKKRMVVREKEIEQAHIALALPGYDSLSEHYYPLLVLNNAFGGTMSSTLFQKIREEKGLAYSVYSYTFSYRNTGGMGIYAGTNATQAKQVLEIILEEIEKLRSQGLPEEDFIRSKNQLRGSYILSSESVSSRMTAMGRNLLLTDRLVSEEETLGRIDSVTPESVKAILADVLDVQSLCAALVGRVGDAQEELSKLW